MKKVKVLNTVSTDYLVAGILFMMGAEDNMVYGYLCVVALVGAWGYSGLADAAKEELRKDEIMKHLDENGEGID